MFIYYLPLYTLIPAYIVFLVGFSQGCRYIRLILQSGGSSSAGGQSQLKAAKDSYELVKDSAGWIKVFAVVSSVLLIAVWWFFTPGERLAAMTTTFAVQASVSFALCILTQLICPALLGRIKGDPMFSDYRSQSRHVTRILFIVAVIFLLIYLFLTC